MKSLQTKRTSAVCKHSTEYQHTETLAQKTRTLSVKFPVRLHFSCYSFLDCRLSSQAQTPVKLTMLSELRALLQANHENVLRFAGIYIAPASQASHAKRHNAAHRRHSTSAPPPPYMADVQLVFDYPLKGSLEALLLQDRLQLDWEFRIALVRDVAQGLQFVQRLVGRHGRVSSRRSCFVDSRFVAKLADYGLPELARANPAGAEPYER